MADVTGTNLKITFTTMNVAAGTNDTISTNADYDFVEVFDNATLNINKSEITSNAIIELTGENSKIKYDNDVNDPNNRLIILERKDGVVKTYSSQDGGKTAYKNPVLFGDEDVIGLSMDCFEAMAKDAEKNNW